MTKEKIDTWYNSFRDFLCSKGLVDKPSQIWNAVWLPALDIFSIDMHNMFTDEKRQLKLTDIAGLPIGHVPKCLSSVFRHVLDFVCLC